MTGPAEPREPEEPAVLVEPAEPTEHVMIARRFLKRRLIRDVVALLVGALFLATGIAGFVYLGNQTDQLAATGVLATATAVEVDNYHYRFQLDEHVVVAFRVSGGVAVTARCYVGASDQFAVGQPVAIVYDPSQPSRAQLAGTPDLGPIGAPFFAAVLVGVLFLVPGGYGLLSRRGAGRAISGPGRPMTAARFARRRIVLRDGHSSLELRVSGRVRRLPRDDDAAVRVFGRPDPRSMLVVVDPSTAAVVLGRMPKPVGD